VKKILLFPLLAIQILAPAQCLIPGGLTDSLFPVTNSLLESENLFGTSFVYRHRPGVFNVTKQNNNFYLLGDFTNLAINQGPALVLDSATHTVLTPQKWKVNGLVHAAIADGQGGFYIGGNFTKIGDSSRLYLAQVNGNGQPTAWKPNIDSVVRALYKRNDTLFIGGAFSKINTKDRPRFGLYSLSGDSVLTAGTHLLFGNLNCINSFIIQKDTLIYGAWPCCSNIASIRKFNFKNSVFLPWQLGFTEYNEVNKIDLSADTATLIYTIADNSAYIKGVNFRTGAEKYRIDVAMYSVSFTEGVMFGLKATATKGYAAGYFKYVRKNNTTIQRKGFFGFDLNTGDFLADDLQLDGYPSFLDIQYDKLYLSGTFTSINNTPREHFAVIDTNNLNLNAWDLSPTDPLTCMAYSAGKVFVAGYFNGVSSVHRNGLAAVDAVTKTILPWNPAALSYIEGKRMMVKGDSLFILGITSRPSSCMINDFNTQFRVISLTTGAVLSTPNMSYSRMDDCVIDSNYLYVSIDRQLRRYLLPSLTLDIGWGVNFTGAGSQHNPMYLIVTANRVYSVGDTRFINPCTTFGPKRGWFIVYDKTNGLPLNYYSYEGLNNQYDEIVFDHAVLSNDQLFVQGYFDTLNNQPRRNFVALNINNGSIGNWRVSFPNTGNAYSELHRTSDLKLYNGFLWFGSSNYSVLNNGRNFPGLAAIDTVTGILMPPLVKLQHNSYGIERYYLNLPSKPVIAGGKGNDFFFDDTTLTVSGDFNLVNAKPSQDIARLKLVPGTPPSITATNIIGPANLYFNTDSNRYYIPGANLDSFSYQWSYTGSGVEIKNNGSDTVWLKVNNTATSGFLKIVSRNYCGTGPETQLAITISLPPLSPDVIVNMTGTVPTSVTANIAFTVRSIVSNIGTAVAPAHKLNYYLSANNVLTPGANGDILLDQSDITIPIPAGASSDTITKNLVIPCSVFTNNYYLFLMADATNQLTESNENNNTTSTTLFVSVINAPATPVITVSPNATVCSPATITLTANSPGCTICTYSWSNGATGNSVTISTTVAQNLTVTANSGCGTAQATQFIQIFPIPPAPPAPTQTGNILTAAITTAIYQWYLGGTAINGATNQTYTITQSGSYTYTYVQNASGCVSAMSPAFNAVLTAIVDPSNPSGLIRFSPNPTTGNLFVTGLGINDQYMIRVISVTGNLAREWQKNGTGISMQIDLSDLSPGPYFIKIYKGRDRKELGTQKLWLLR
jgi:hypothetical protein